MTIKPCRIALLFLALPLMQGLAHARSTEDTANAAISRHQARIWHCGEAFGPHGQPTMARQRLAQVSRNAAAQGPGAITGAGCRAFTYTRDQPGHSTSILETIGPASSAADGTLYLPVFLVESNTQATGYNFEAIVALSPATTARPPARIAWQPATTLSPTDVMRAEEAYGPHPLGNYPGVAWPQTPESQHAAATFARMSHRSITDPTTGYVICPDRATSQALLSAGRRARPMMLAETVAGLAQQKCRRGRVVLPTVGAWDMVIDTANQMEGGWFAVTAVENGKPVEVLGSWWRSE